MNSSTRRTAACGGALAVAIGVGAILAPAANASVIGTGSVGGSVGSTVGSTVTSITGGGTSVTTPTTSGTGGTVGSTASGTEGVVATSGSGVAGTVQSGGDGTNATTQTATNGTQQTADGVTTTVGTTTDGATGTTTGSDVAGTAQQGVDAVTGAVDGIVGTSTSGNSAAGTTGGSTDGVTNGGIDVTVGSTGDGGSLAEVALGGTTNGVAGGTTGGSTGSTTTPLTGTLGGSTGTPGTTASSGSAATAIPARLLGLGVGRSVTTVYPVKDGYRDDVVFTLDGVTSDGAVQSIDGTAVLRRGTRTVERWTLTRSDQQLRWDGRVGDRILSGTYTLVAGASDAAGHAYTTSTKVLVSAKRLVASTAKLSSTVVSGRHTMLAAPRAGLGRGDVTLRITTVATKVKGGAQRLIFEKNGRRITVPITKGTTTSRAITIPKSFTDFTIKHTWKKGDVVLKSIHYTYAYQSLK